LRGVVLGVTGTGGDRFDPAGILSLRAGAGLFRAPSTGVLEAAGSDATPFLQSQLPADVSVLSPGDGVYTASLDNKGRLTHDLLLLRLPEGFLALTERSRLPSLMEKLERYHVREDVLFRDRAEEFLVLELHGPAVPVMLGRLSGAGAAREPFRHRVLEMGGKMVRYVDDPWTGDPGGHLLLDPADEGPVREAVLAAGEGEGLVELPSAVSEVLRIEGGRARVGVDVDERTLLLELDLPGMVSFTKGCYLGQETVARIHARGHVNRLWRGLLLEGEHVPPPRTPIHHGESPVGETRSAAHSPSLGRPIALAMLRREAAEPGTVVHLELREGWTAARVVQVPLYRPPGPGEEADRLHREGLAAFTADRYEAALSLFERATLMNPEHYAAYESAGVCLERLGRLGEAIEAMRGLTEVDPDNVMAWTNLSRYHAQQGRIEEAERIKGHVTYLLWKKEAGEREARRRTEEEQKEARARLQERVGMFQQVLELDPDDVVANFGLGKMYLDLDRFEEAVPRFRRAIEGHKDYSVAYSHLATSLLALGRMEEGRRALEEGIAVADRKGDLLPRRDMERKLAELDDAEPA
jgi:aminomethyltransferase